MFKTLFKTPLKRPWYWERLKAGGEGDNRGWDGWMASPTRWTWVWANSGRWWWTGKPGVLQSMWWQRAGHDWAAEQQSSISLSMYAHTCILSLLFFRKTVMNTTPCYPDQKSCLLLGKFWKSIRLISRGWKCPTWTVRRLIPSLDPLTCPASIQG